MHYSIISQEGNDVAELIANEGYWNTYYKNQVAIDQANHTKLIPSQFAAFVLSEFSNRDRFIDFGCGNGRDSFFFAEHGKRLMGVDGSAVVIEQSNRTATQGNYSNLAFNHLDLLQKNECTDFLKKHRAEWAGAIFYARFFLHAITEEIEDNFLHICSEIMGSTGRICVEFRTDKDEYQIKETASHYRRFIDPLTLINKMTTFGLRTDYYSEGYGYAKYKNDNAHVARLIAVKV